MKHKIEGKMFSYGQMSEIWLHFPNGIFFTFHNFAKNMERSEVNSAVPRHLTTTDAVTGKCFPDMS